MEESAFKHARQNRSGAVEDWLILFLALSTVVALVIWLRTESYRPIEESKGAQMAHILDSEPVQPLPPTNGLDEKEGLARREAFQRRQLSSEELGRIESFLKTLSGEYKGKAL